MKRQEDLSLSEKLKRISSTAITKRQCEMSVTATNNTVSPVHFAYAEVYARKLALGGGFRGVAVNKITGIKYTGEIRDTLQEAKNDVKTFVFAQAADRNMTTGTYRNTDSSWRCNYYIRSDEV